MIGKVLLEYPLLESTNTTAWQLLDASPAEGTVVITPKQTQGKGQWGATWVSEAHKNLMLSVILYPDFLAIERQFALTRAVSIALIRLLTPFLQDRVKIKWPNDLFCQDRKLGGILTQNLISGGRWQAAVVGIGLNVLQRDFPHLPHATSVSLEAAHCPTVEHLRDGLFRHMDATYAALKEDDRAFDDEYVKYLYRKDQLTHFTLPDGSGFEGHIEGVSDVGRLMVADARGQRFQFLLKEVQYT